MIDGILVGKLILVSKTLFCYILSFSSLLNLVRWKPKFVFSVVRVEFVQAMTGWLADGSIQYKEQVVDGLENAPSAMNDLLVGKSFGKMVVKVD